MHTSHNTLQVPANHAKPVSTSLRRSHMYTRLAFCGFVSRFRQRISSVVVCFSRYRTLTLHTLTEHGERKQQARKVVCEVVRDGGEAEVRLRLQIRMMTHNSFCVLTVSRVRADAPAKTYYALHIHSLHHKLLNSVGTRSAFRWFACTVLRGRVLTDCRQHCRQHFREHACR